jgi:hypothetical protein
VEEKIPTMDPDRDYEKVVIRELGLEEVDAKKRRTLFNLAIKAWKTNQFPIPHFIHVRKFLESKFYNPLLAQKLELPNSNDLLTFAAQLVLLAPLHEATRKVFDEALKRMGKFNTREFEFFIAVVVWIASSNDDFKEVKALLATIIDQFTEAAMTRVPEAEPGYRAHSHNREPSVATMEIAQPLVARFRASRDFVAKAAADLQREHKAQSATVNTLNTADRESESVVRRDIDVLGRQLHDLSRNIEEQALTITDLRQELAIAHDTSRKVDDALWDLKQRCPDPQLAATRMRNLEDLVRTLMTEIDEGRASGASQALLDQRISEVLKQVDLISANSEQLTADLAAELLTLHDMQTNLANNQTVDMKKLQAAVQSVITFKPYEYSDPTTVLSRTVTAPANTRGRPATRDSSPEAIDPARHRRAPEVQVAHKEARAPSIEDVNTAINQALQPMMQQISNIFTELHRSRSTITNGSLDDLPQRPVCPPGQPRLQLNTTSDRTSGTMHFTADHALDYVNQLPAEQPVHAKHDFYDKLNISSVLNRLGSPSHRHGSAAPIAHAVSALRPELGDPRDRALVAINDNAQRTIEQKAKMQSTLCLWPYELDDIGSTLPTRASFCVFSYPRTFADLFAHENDVTSTAVMSAIKQQYAAFDTDHSLPSATFSAENQRKLGNKMSDAFHGTSYLPWCEVALSNRYATLMAQCNANVTMTPDAYKEARTLLFLRKIGASGTDTKRKDCIIFAFWQAAYLSPYSDDIGPSSFVALFKAFKVKLLFGPRAQCKVNFLHVALDAPPKKEPPAKKL